MGNRLLFKLIVASLLILFAEASSNLSHSGEPANVSLTGSMRHITDSLSNNYNIEFFRMSGDGSRVAFLVNQTIRDSRDCFAQQIRIMNTDGTDETVVEQGFTFDTGVGNFCAKNLSEHLDISNDGTIVAYSRLNNPEDQEPEIVVYHVETGEKTVVLSRLPFRAFGEQNSRIIDPFGGGDSNTFKLSGDGKWLYFLNLFGPFGSPGNSGDPDESGKTLYKVATDGSGATPILSDKELPNIPGIDPEAESINLAEEIDVNFDGSIAILALSDVRGGAHFFRNLIKITNDSEISILLNLGDFQYRGGSLSDDGTQLAYAQSHIPSSSGGIYIMNTVEPFNPIQIDPGGFFRVSLPSRVRLSGDGTATSQSMNVGGDPSLRWSNRDRVSLIEQPAARISDPNSQISENGRKIVFEGSILSEGRFAGDQPEELIMFEWSSMDLSEAHIASVLGEPSLFLLQFGFREAFSNTYFFNTTGPSTFLFNIPLDGDANKLTPIAGFSDVGGVVDDGEFEEVDQQANDGIYTEGGIWASSGFGKDFTLPQGAVFQFTVRSMITSVDRSASFVEFPVRILPNPDVFDEKPFLQESVGSFTAERTGVFFELLENPGDTEIFIHRWEQPFVDLENSIGKIWHVHGFDETRRGLLTIFYEDDELEAVGLEESAVTLLRSDDGGLNWFAVVSEVDFERNRIAAVASISETALWSIAASSTAIREWNLY